MKERGRASVSAQMLAAFVDGEVTPSEAERIEAAQAESASTRRKLAQLRRIRRTLSSPVPELETIDLVASLRARIASGEPPAKPAARVWTLALAASVAATCALALVFLVPKLVPTHARPPGAAEDEFRAKSAASPNAARWAGIQAYSVDGDAPPQPIVGRLARRHGLLFSYSNLGPEPFEYLMIFLTDAHGSVHWCFPAYQEPGTNPAAIRIRKGESSVPLPELIHLAPTPGPATLYALFSLQPLRVLDVEAWLHRPRTEHVPGTFYQVFQIEIEP